MRGAGRLRVRRHSGQCNSDTKNARIGMCHILSRWEGEACAFGEDYCPWQAVCCFLAFVAGVTGRMLTHSGWHLGGSCN